jgi:Rrf2 family cysteine metabolism transcriptional repressor
VHSSVGTHEDYLANPRRDLGEKFGEPHSRPFRFSDCAEAPLQPARGWLELVAPMAGALKRTAVPSSVLEQVMPALRSAGLVRSERGAHSGYRLNKSPEEITLERVVRLFQGPLAPIGCATRSHPEPCQMSVDCSLRFIWEGVRDATIAALASTTFADLASRAGGPWRAPVA